MRRTKLVCTLGPAVAGRVGELIDAGMNVARVNLSHGTPEDHAAAITAVRSEAAARRTAVGVLADLSGPKVRLGEIDGGEILLEPGSRFVLRSTGDSGDATGASTTHPGLATDLLPGDRVLLADGAAELRVTSCDGDCVTEVVAGGVVRSRAGVNIPSQRLSLPALTEKDTADLERVLSIGADIIAQSFVRSASDVENLRALAGDDVLIMAKIETGAAVDDFDRIATVSDALMLARGDLGVELPYERIPIVQVDLVRRAAALGIPIVIATQMLESMIHNPRPTRAEATDVAGAVMSGVDAILLSAETAIGSHPIGAARAADRIARAAEETPDPIPVDRRTPPRHEAQAIAQAAAALTRRPGGPAAIACYTRTGLTAELLSAARPVVPIFAFSAEASVVRRLTLRRAVTPFLCDPPATTDEMIAGMDTALRARGLAGEGSIVAMVASTPSGSQWTNLLKVHRIGRG